MLANVTKRLRSMSPFKMTVHALLALPLGLQPKANMPKENAVFKDKALSKPYAI